MKLFLLKSLEHFLEFIKPSIHVDQMRGGCDKDALSYVCYKILPTCFAELKWSLQMGSFLFLVLINTSFQTILQITPKSDLGLTMC